MNKAYRSRNEIKIILILLSLMSCYVAITQKCTQTNYTSNPLNEK
jgi:hypothetical protein